MFTIKYFSLTCLRRLLVIPIALSLSCSGLFHHIEVYPPPTNLAQADHVVILVIDGLRPEAITKTEMPTLDGILRASIYSLDAQTIFPSNTLPSLASLITGLPPDEHKINWNYWRPGWRHLEVPSIFDLAREAGLKTALFGGKNKLLHLTIPGAIDRVNVREQPDATVMRHALEFINNDHPNLVLIHLPNVDGAGHLYGWLSLKQRQTIMDTDKLIGELIETLKAFRHEGEKWVMIITADHGGHERTHGSDDPIDTTIPWIVWGDASISGQIARVSITSTATTAARTLRLQLPENWIEHEETSTIKSQTTQSHFSQ